MALSPAALYQQSIDKQRIVITGQGNAVIGAVVRHVLTQHKRKFDYVGNGQAGLLTDAPVLIIEAPVSPELLDYKHHLGVLSRVEQANSEELHWLERFANATPKSGILIYADSDSKIKAIATKERADVLTIPFKTYAHEIQQGKTLLTASTQEKFPISLSGDLHLQYLSAAKEVLKKIGISSGQFYEAITTFQLN